MTKLIAVIFILGAAAVAFLQWSRKSIVTTTYQYAHKKIPAQFEGFRIVHVSDLQSEYFGRKQKNLLRAVKNGNPDIIVFTGDLLDRNHTDFDASMTAIKGLSEIAPVYFIDGNHELALPAEDVQHFYDRLDAVGIRRIFDRAVVLGKDSGKIVLAGLSEETICESKVRGGVLAEGQVSSRGKVSDTDIEPLVIKETLERILQNCRPEDFIMLLAHEPQFLETYAKGKADFIFAGHAHGGQIRLPLTKGLFAPGQGLFPKMTSGIHRRGETDMVISRGLGNSTFPFRIWNRPEIVIVELHQ